MVAWEVFSSSPETRSSGATQVTHSDLLDSTGVDEVCNGIVCIVKC